MVSASDLPRTYRSGSGGDVGRSGPAISLPLSVTNWAIFLELARGNAARRNRWAFDSPAAQLGANPKFFATFAIEEDGHGCNNRSEPISTFEDSGPTTFADLFFRYNLTAFSGIASNFCSRFSGTIGDVEEPKLQHIR